MPRGRKKQVPESPAPEIIDIKPGEEIELPEDIKPEKKEDKPIKGKVKFECGFAPLGKSSVAFNHTYGGELYEYNLKLENKIFVLPPDLSVDDIKRYRAALTANNFIDITVNHGIVFNKETGEFTYTVVHPDHSEKNSVNATIGIVLIDHDKRPVVDKKGNQITKQVSILNGIVKTEDERVYNALLKAGFYDKGRKERSV